jgi:hypothetical protein
MAHIHGTCSSNTSTYGCVVQLHGIGSVRGDGGEAAALTGG